MIINVKYLLSLWTNKEEEVRFQGSTLADLINELSERDGPKFRNLFYRGSQLMPFKLVSVNGKLVSESEGFDKRLKDGDTVSFFPPISGG